MEYADLLDQFEALAIAYRGWSLTEIRDLSPRERYEWIQRADRRT